MAETEFGQYKYEDSLSLSSKALRLLWNIAWAILFRPTPAWCMHGWRRALLVIFGAEIGEGFRVAPSCKVWAPWRLVAKDYVCLAGDVDCYNVSKIQLGNKVTVSQRAFLCTASHDITSLKRPLVAAPIVIDDHAWVCAQAFVGPGVTVGRGSVVGAGAVVTRDVANWVVVAGNPAKLVKRRVVNCAESGRK